ncbi:MAG: hypothetical protein GF399_10470 [Candidatus Coatesbacteria bacterium]|nr:hypothetical protein [Candidatus Coatesbacteria bacterium]
MKTLILKLAGLKCDHCAAAVRRSLETVPGVDEAVVTLEPMQARVLCEAAAVEREKLIEAVETAGYQVVSD